MTVCFDRDRGKWRYDFKKDKRRYRGYCLDARGAPVTSRSAAKQAEGVEKRRIAIAPKLASIEGYSFAQALDALIPEWELQASWSNRERYIRELLQFFGADSALAAIDADRVAQYVTHTRTRPRLLWKGGPLRDPGDPKHARFWVTGKTLRGPHTSNLYLGTLRQALQHGCRVKDPVSGRPVLSAAPHVPELATPKRKARPVPDAVLIALRSLLPQHAIEAMTVTLLFGFRRGEAFTLTIPQVDFDAHGVRLEAEGVKENEDAFIPGSPIAMRYLKRLITQARKRGVNELITWRRRHEGEAWRALKRPKSSWRRAMAEIELRFGKRWRWHDLRAAFITHVALTSGGLAAQSLARHSEFSTTQAYIEVADDVRRRAAEKVTARPALKAIAGGKVTHSGSPTRPMAKASTSRKR